MRLVKGSKVEILVNTHVLGVEWHGARIVSGNGHTYEVEYDSSSATDKALSTRVPRKAIRPCPPAMENIGSWRVNDIVEVWNAGCWKEATVLKYITGEFFLVRLKGSCTELKVHEDNMRICQSWLNGQWIISPKGPTKSGVVNFSRNLISNNYKAMPEVQHTKDVWSPGLDASCLHQPSPSTLKRMLSHGSLHIEEYPRKKRVVVTMGESKRLKAVSTAPLLEKVDAIAYPHNNMGENYMHVSFPNQLYETKKPCNVTTHFPESIEKLDYSYSNLSSVGSCSVISGSANEFYGVTLAGACQDDEDTLRSDAESLNVEDMEESYGDMFPDPRPRDECTISTDEAESLDVDEECAILPKEVVEERIHRLELNAYNCTLEAMYASGPLSWEKEELLTNLRISLNISNDEHLSGIKYLVSADQNF
ncbi:uncharacterized protein LOC123897254 isoform X1 [Trifolium pratense]|uniref:uncharacterized protein LOC123897254 isoform X1 n=1 Tax=Trifolium pratense TaxID=57577 RepID=UPI001E690FE0|nr:uncharacterized protein LOC123897254 isoform X1 [Trifolium pratense]